MFEKRQSDHRAEVKERLESAILDIRKSMRSLYETTFSGDSIEVQREWVKYTARVDKDVEDALRKTVKASMLDLSRAINGDAKAPEVLPLFNVHVVLEATRNKVELRPSLDDLLLMVNGVARELIFTIQVVPRLVQLPAEEMQKLPSFYNIINNDEDTTLKIIVAIMGGINNSRESLGNFLSHFEKSYKQLWEQDKDAYMKRYERQNKSLAAFEADIISRKETEERIQNEDSIVNMAFLKVDCTPLKQSMVSHCENWVDRFTALLNDISRRELESLHAYFETQTALMARYPTSLVELSASKKLLDSTKADMDGNKARFEPLRDRYASLLRFEVGVAEAELASLGNLTEVWEDFTAAVAACEVMMDKAKAQFQGQLEGELDEFLSECGEMRNAFKHNAPYAKEPNTVETAFKFIRAEQDSLKRARERQKELADGLEIFDMEEPSYKELTDIDRDLTLLEQVWDLIKEWEDQYDQWKYGLFADLDAPSMEEKAIGFLKRMKKLGREVNPKGWSNLREEEHLVSTFKSTMPLILDLRNPAMRRRHWEQLMKEIGRDFEPEGSDFTLDMVFKLKLDEYAEFIGNLAAAASKELGIEQALDGIDTTWLGPEALKLEVEPYKTAFRLVAVDDIFAALEDNTVTLSTMKASRFYLAFETRITGWEKKLSHIGECIEYILNVQRAWMYLENIFLSEEIKKELPAESALFIECNDVFVSRMNSVQTSEHAVGATHAPGFLDDFVDTSEKLEKIQKSLDSYLEQKRQQFPRFYFVSSDDLLEILGQSSDPQNVQQHLKKCFEGIKKIDMHPPGEDGRKQFESDAMFAPDTEKLQFPEAVKTEGRPEEWLNGVEAAMFDSTKLYLYRTVEAGRAKGKGKKEKWVKDFPGQCIITAGQMAWTAECERALSDPDNSKMSLRKLKKKWISYLNKLTAMVRGSLDRINRSKVVALITIEVHARDVIDKLFKSGCSAVSDFQWLSQLRFYWDHNHDNGKDNDALISLGCKGDCIVRQVISTFVYGYEYQGNNGRLVITPLTDRCYMTLGAALFTRRGGNPLGPAGTGKTETVKDLGKALAKYVIVFNCSDGVDYKMTAKMFSGLAQTGSWSCLDEFNRIEVEVLSVVATQIECVMQAIKEGKDRFVFEGVEIRLIRSCGVFVTMNPGYAGRSELPDNLKAIVRPVSMMVPDFTLIAEIMLFSEGFSSAKSLSKKMVAIMELSQQQLSKQDHYDYGLRSFVIPIARAAGAHKRNSPDMNEDVIMFRTMKDLILPKLVYADLPLFHALVGDLFPGIEMPVVDYGKLQDALETELRDIGLQVVPAYVSKIIQLYDCKVSRHGNMLVGKTGAGKSEAWQCLQRAMARLNKNGVEGFEKVHVPIINPLALSNDEIYGYVDANTNEWTDGILAKIMRTVCKDESPDEKWILFDGPVDTLWIESLNTVLDDNKLLTLISGERISMPPMVSILFEVEDLSQASPATVSRAGMIYMNVEDLGWRPYVTSWLARKSDAVLVETLNVMFDKYAGPALEYKRRNCSEMVSITALNAIISLCTLFDAYALREEGGLRSGAESYINDIEQMFWFSMLWSIGGSVDDAGRKIFDTFIKGQSATLPAKDLVYDWYYDLSATKWVAWEEKLNASYKPSVDVPFFKIFVPTVDTLRNKSLLQHLVSVRRPALFVGGVGVGKTLTVQSGLGSLPDNLTSVVINMSAQTSSNQLQDTLEGKVEKRTKGVFAPPGGKKLVAFIDDLNMPKKSVFGFIPPHELLKLWMDHGLWYDRGKQEIKYIKDIQLVASMGPPGGGRNHMSNRVLACFSEIFVSTPSEGQMKRIFGSMLTSKLSDFEDALKPLADELTTASITLYSEISEQLLPTPSKSHYLFNMRDLAKIIQGVMQATRAYYDSREQILQLWGHECFRVLGDRMWDFADKDWLKNNLDEKFDKTFGSSWKSLYENSVMPCFVSFMRQIDNPPYEPCYDMLAMKGYLMERMDDYGLEPGKSPMDLVLFNDAMQHVCRIYRVLKQPRGNVMMVGVGGSGRKSVSKLGAYVADLKTFSIEITKNYRVFEFHEDLKMLYRQAGVENKPTLFLMDDTQIINEIFLEDINNILTSGEVPNLFSKDEINGVCEEVRADGKAANAGQTGAELLAFFMERVRSNLHVIVCMSPIGELFRSRLRMFPGLVNCTTIDWYTEWPDDALYEVATKLMEEVNLGSAEVRDNACKLFMTVHSSVSSTSARMLQELKRKNYVTPTNYLEFVNGYKAMLAKKRAFYMDQKEKLQGGLEKLEETKIQVAEMKLVAQEKQVTVAQTKKDCEEMLVEIVQEKRLADEQEKHVSLEAEKITKEAEEMEEFMKEVQLDLDAAMPALIKAEDALKVLTKKDISEMKAYTTPPALVEMVLCSVMLFFKKTPTWKEAKVVIGDSQFLDKLQEYDKDLLTEQMMGKIRKYTVKDEYDPEKVGKQSGAAKGLCIWVQAMEVYFEVAKNVAPKRAKLAEAQKALAKKEAALQEAKDTLAEVLAKVKRLNDTFEASSSQKEALVSELEQLEMKLNRAEQLVDGLGGEKVRWEASIESFEGIMDVLPGDCIIASAFMSYAGPFPSDYRDSLVKHTWIPMVKKLKIPSSPTFSFSDFLADPSDVRDWNIQGLPADSFSTENGVMVTRGTRWPLMIDPQGQANAWVKNMEQNNSLKVVDLKAHDLLRTMENAIQFGNPVLIEDVLEELDPALEPILAKSFIKQGNRLLIKVGDKELDYNEDFKLYITTKLQNPHYTPEVSTKTTIINFSVKESGLEAQLLNLVVKREQPTLDKRKNEVVVQMAKDKRAKTELEDQILYLLATATGSLLDNIELINTLNNSKVTSQQIEEGLKTAEVTKAQIEVKSNEYRAISIRAAVLFFVINDLPTVDPMYQFSLDAYIELFEQSIAKSQHSSMLDERIRQLNNYHTYAVYKYVSRGLFEKHKMLLSLQICVRILQNGNAISNEEWNFFLRGGTVLDKSDQPANPAPSWIMEPAWDHITELNNLENFDGIVASFTGNTAQWEEWYRQPEPELIGGDSVPLPGEWEGKCNELQRMIFVRCLRPDRAMFSAAGFVANNLGQRYIEPPVLDLVHVYADSVPTAPLIFVLSPGIDPVANLRQLAAAKGMKDKLFSLALGQGQGPIAQGLIETGVKEGHWVFLANCHLMLSWLPALEKIIAGLSHSQPHENFRLWLSSNPHPQFPIAILQRGLKMTTEPPKGLKANLTRIYNAVEDVVFTTKCKTQSKYKKLFFALSYFHSVLLERRKFLTLGFNIPYDFNDTDLAVSDDLLATYLDEYEETAWDAIKYLISEANYGGRVTDELDRRVLNSYLNQYYCEDALDVPQFKFSSLSTYYIPDDGPLRSYKEYIATLPAVDRPEAFGQHPNADIAFQITGAQGVLDTIVGLQPKTGGAEGGHSREEIVMGLAEGLAAQVPVPWILEDVQKEKEEDPSALHVVLFQEVERYNGLLRKVKADCENLVLGIKGLVLISADLEVVFNALFDAKVPASWLKVYPSLKPLGAWMRELLERIEMFDTWIKGTYPSVWWLTAFTYPTGFLTAILQTTARRHSIAIDTLAFDYSIVSVAEDAIEGPPKEGCYVRGMYLEGAGWDPEGGCLCEPNPMELIVPMPVMHFKPVENKKKLGKNIYQTPLFMYPIRTGSRERPSYMISVELKSGERDPDWWIKRGTALLLSLAN